MQKKIGTEINLGKTVSPFDSISSSSAPLLLFKTVSNFLNARAKVQKIKKLIKQENMMLTLQNTYLEHSSASIRECLKILTEKCNSLREKCPNTELLLVRIVLYLN